MSNYPVVLTDLESGVVVVGGGEVAARKVEGLLAAGACVTVISPRFAPALEQLAEQDRVTILRRAYQPGDLKGARLAIAATDDPVVNRAVWQEAQERGCLVNVVDDPAHCTFHAPAVVRRGPVTVAVGTGGSSPALAKHLRREIEVSVGPEYGQLAALLAELRPRVQAHIPPEKREPLWQDLVQALLPFLRDGKQMDAHQTAEEILKRAQEQTAVGSPSSAIIVESDHI